MTEVVRSWYGRALTVAVAAICAGMCVIVAVAGSLTEAAQMAPWTALVTLACWATFWRPMVAVSDAGVRIVNVTRTIDVPWPALRGLDTRWALTLVTAYGRFTAWSAPAPGARSALRSLATEARRDVPRTLRKPTAQSEQFVAPGELLDTPSGDAAALVQRRWDALRAAGHLADPRLEHERAPVHWHVGSGLAALALVAAGVGLAMV